eukprot:gene9360-10335_t
MKKIRSSRNHLLPIGLVLVTVIFLIVQISYNVKTIQIILSPWGNTFIGFPLQSFHLPMDCQYEGQPVCCSLLEEKKKVKNKKGGRLPTTSSSSSSCRVTRVYQPSPYEQRHLAFAQEVSKISSEEERRRRLQHFLFEDLSAASKWLDRVAYRATTPTVTTTTTATLTEDDVEYLSRFRVTQVCHQRLTHQEEGEEEVVGVGPPSTTTNWYEWIEPISLHGRHPFGLAHCPALEMDLDYDEQRGGHGLHYQKHFYPLDRSNYSMMNMDYLLFQERADLLRSVAPPPPATASLGGGGSQRVAEEEGGGRRVLFDIGTSTFGSSLAWVLCAYQQRGIDFHAIYGWETTLLEPVAFWQKVPPSVLPFYHFFNVPITLPASSAAFMGQMTNIDNPSIEIPLILHLLHDDKTSALIDELFFELHFQCEFMMECGWGRDIPSVSREGLPLDRYHALRLFQELREKGIRAHLWP